MIEVFLGLGDGTFQPPLTTGAPEGVSGLVVGDFNGDGKLDLAVDYSSPDGKTGSILIYLGKGDGTFASSVSYPTSPQTGSVVAGDFNGDGRLDLAFIQGGSSSTPNATLNILLGKGDGTFSAAATTPLPPAYSAFGKLNVADFNGDGKLDLAFGVAPSGPGAPPLSSTLVLLGRGDGSFQAPVVYPVATEAAADMNGDHILDLVAYDPATGYSCYLPGLGDGTFLPEVTLVPVTPGLLVVADFNTDGRLDLADISSVAGYDSVLYSGIATFLNTSQPSPPLTVVSAASFSAPPFAADSLASAFGKDLSFTTKAAESVPLPTMLAETTVSIQDSTKAIRPAPLLYVSPQQVNFLIPAGSAAGTATVTVTTQILGLTTVHSAQIQIAAVAPSMFELNADGLAASYVVRVAASNLQTIDSVFSEQGGKIVTKPIDLGAATDQVYLILYGTGIRNAGSGEVTVNIQGLEVPVSYAGPQTQFAGLDQVNVLLPRALASTGVANIVLSAGGKTANTVYVSIK
jgi:uncharacterized protein (TIGR03437 family)